MHSLIIYLIIHGIAGIFAMIVGVLLMRHGAKIIQQANSILGNAVNELVVKSNRESCEPDIWEKRNLKILAEAEKKNISSGIFVFSCGLFINICGLYHIYRIILRPFWPFFIGNLF